MCGKSTTGGVLFSLFIPGFVPGALWTAGVHFFPLWKDSIVPLSLLQKPVVFAIAAMVSGFNIRPGELIGVRCKLAFPGASEKSNR